MDFFKNLDYYLKLVYNAVANGIRLTPTATAPTVEDIGESARLDEILEKIYDPSTNAFRVNITGGDLLNQKNQKIVSTGATQYPLAYTPRGTVAVTEKGGSRVDPDDVGGITVVMIAGIPNLTFGIAPPVGVILFADYIY